MKPFLHGLGIAAFSLTGCMVGDEVADEDAERRRVLEELGSSYSDDQNYSCEEVFEGATQCVYDDGCSVIWDQNTATGEIYVRSCSYCADLPCDTLDS